MALRLRCGFAQGHSIRRYAKAEWFTMSESERSEGESNGGPGWTLNCLDKDAGSALFFRVFNSIRHEQE